ncbi:MAG: hypothetical protein AB7S38_24110 [Vulcanimicrobiota bacterium]
MELQLNDALSLLGAVVTVALTIFMMTRVPKPAGNAPRATFPAPKNIRMGRHPILRTQEAGLDLVRHKQQMHFEYQGKRVQVEAKGNAEVLILMLWSAIESQGSPAVPTETGPGIWHWRWTFGGGTSDVGPELIHYDTGEAQVTLDASGALLTLETVKESRARPSGPP